MSMNCEYSFIDLFKAAHKREPTQEDARDFVMSSQDERNEKIKKWADAAGWETEDQTGSDGQVYTAFYPKG